MKNLNHANVVAVTSDIKTAGSIVYANYHGDLDRAALETAWASEGLPEDILPEEVSFRTAFNRAVEAVTTGNVFRRRHPKGWLLVLEDTDQDGAEYQVQAIASLNAVQQVEVEPEDSEFLAPLRTGYDFHLRRITSNDASQWVRNKLLPKLGAVRLRADGGLYFVPQPAVETWRKMVMCIRAASQHQIFQIPALSCDDAVAAIMDAIIQEATVEADNIEADVQGGELKEKALRGRGRRAERMIEKVEQYEQLLDVKLGAIRERLSQLQASSVEAALRAMEVGE